MQPWRNFPCDLSSPKRSKSKWFLWIYKTLPNKVSPGEWCTRFGCERHDNSVDARNPDKSSPSTEFSWEETREKRNWLVLREELFFRFMILVTSTVLQNLDKFSYLSKGSISSVNAREFGKHFYRQSHLFTVFIALKRLQFFSTW